MSSASDDKINSIMNELQKDKVYEAEAFDSYQLTNDEEDALGEIGNICMGTSATTLYTLFGKKVSITTPRVSICRSAKDLGEYQKPFVAVEISYTEGINGYSIFLLKESDVILMTDLLMGGDGNVDASGELGELQLSAISEVMNQMIGSASTALADILHKPVNITPPKVTPIMLEDENLGKLACGNDVMIKTSFVMEIEDLLVSEIMQILPFNIGKQLAASLLNGIIDEKQDMQKAPPQQSMPKQPPSGSPMPDVMPRPVRNEQQQEKNRVGVRAVQYQSFDATSPYDTDQDSKENINLIMDVPLQVTVELGKTKKSIKEILSFSTGSVIVLDRLAGEMVDILVNGKLFAKGEVVVIDDNYGVRVTDILASPRG